MALTINDQAMTSDRTPHAARLAPGKQPEWEVSWLPRRRVTRNQAITAMWLAEASDDRYERWTYIQVWAYQLGMTGDEALTMVAAEPAWGATAETDPREDRPRGKRMSQPRHAKLNANSGPHADLAPAEQPTADGDRAAGRRRALHAAPGPVPAPAPKDPWAPGTKSLGRPLTWEEIFVSAPGDPDFWPGDPDQFLEEDFIRFEEWDRAIDREPEIE